MFTSATRCALTLSIIPLISMVLGAALDVEALTVRKTVGVSGGSARACRAGNNYEVWYS
jgi:hypothetical protein